MTAPAADRVKVFRLGLNAAEAGANKASALQSRWSGSGSGETYAALDFPSFAAAGAWSAPSATTW